MVDPQELSNAEPELLTGLPEHQKYVAVILAVFILIVVIELVRRRKLREEYSFLWIGTSVVLMALALEPRLLNLFCNAIGAKTPNPALFFGGLVFLMSVSLMMSVRLSKLSFRNKSLTQQMSLQRREIEELHQQVSRLQKAVGTTGDHADEALAPPRKGIAKDGAA